jgi:DNA polymerase-3 subunit delta'
VSQDAPTDRHAEVAAALAEGSPRRFIELTRQNGVELYRLMRRAIERDDRPAQFKLAGLASDSAGMRQFLALFEGYLTRRLRTQPEPEAGGRIPPVPLVSLAGLWEKAAVSGLEVETYNLDRRQFVLDLVETAAATFRQSGSIGIPDKP